MHLNFDKKLHQISVASTYDPVNGHITYKGHPYGYYTYFDMSFYFTTNIYIINKSTMNKAIANCSSLIFLTGKAMGKVSIS